MVTRLGGRGPIHKGDIPPWEKADTIPGEAAYVTDISWPFKRNIFDLFKV